MYRLAVARHSSSGSSSSSSSGGGGGGSSSSSSSNRSRELGCRVDSRGSGWQAATF